MSKVTCISLLLLSGTIMHLWSSDVVWEGFNDSLGKKEAEKVSLNSKDADMLKKAGLYFFNLSSGAHGVQQDSKNKLELARTAVDYLEAAYKIDRKNPVIVTWTATANLSLAGISKKLSDKIRYSNRGVSLFDSIKESSFGNLNYLSMRTISFTPVPKTFKNLTQNVLESGQRYRDILAREKDSLSGEVLETALVLEHSILVSMAYVEYILKHKDVAKQYFSKVNESMMLRGNSKDSTVGENFYFLRKKFR